VGECNPDVWVALGCDRPAGECGGLKSTAERELSTDLIEFSTG
jgi:hypothetical protein